MKSILGINMVTYGASRLPLPPRGKFNALRSLATA